MLQYIRPGAGRCMQSSKADRRVEQLSSGSTPANRRTSMTLPLNKTKIVCTIGPASHSRDVMEKLLLAGMNVARLNFSHGDFSGHKEVIEKICAEQPGPSIAVLP